MKKGTANAEKEALLAEDDLPYQKAKVTQAAVLKKLTKARNRAETVEAAAQAAAKQAAEDKKAAEEAAEAAAQAKVLADEAEAAAAAAQAEAQAQLDELKAQGGTPHGKIWWMERIVAERKKFMK
jgi:regulator of protease activity HflC (stomatin/prohibitin superfamily)